MANRPGGGHGTLTWAEWARQAGVDPDAAQPSKEDLAKVHEMDSSDDPALQRIIDARKAWRATSDARNQWMEYAAGQGVDQQWLEDQGIKNAKEMGKATYSGFGDAWSQALASDPSAQKFANSPEYGRFVKQFGLPYFAFRNWEAMQNATNGRDKSGAVDKMSNGLYYTGGVNGSWYNEFNQYMGSGFVPGVTYADGRTIDQAWQDNHPGATLPSLQYAQGIPNAPGAGASASAQGTPQTGTGPAAPTAPNPFGAAPESYSPAQRQGGGQVGIAANGQAQLLASATPAALPPPRVPTSNVLPGQATGLGAGFSAAGANSTSSGYMDPTNLSSVPNLLSSVAFQRLRQRYGFSASDSGSDILGLKGGGVAWGGVPPWLMGWRPPQQHVGSASVGGPSYGGGQRNFLDAVQPYIQPYNPTGQGGGIPRGPRQRQPEV